MPRRRIRRGPRVEMDELFAPQPELEPKREGRFIVEFHQDLNIPSYLCSYFDRPAITEGVWDKMTAVFYDPIGPSATKAIYGLLKRFNYSFPRHVLIEKTDYYYENDYDVVYLMSVDPTGVVVETWLVQMGVINSVDFGKCDYSSDEIQKVTMVFTPSSCELL
jgi:hypothetical protein